MSRTKSQPQRKPQALFRLFRLDDDEPIELLLPATQFDFNLEYDGRRYRYSGATAIEDIPQGYPAIASWDFGEFTIKSLHPASSPESLPAHCAVCSAPFPLHTIRCGTAA